MAPKRGAILAAVAAWVALACVLDVKAEPEFNDFHVLPHVSITGDVRVRVTACIY